MAKTHYVDNKHFYDLMVERHEGLKSNPDLKISEALGKIIIDISTNLTYNRSFIRYSYREELISDGIENCVRYLDNFDCTRFKNPFAYFTRIVWNAFIRKIQKKYKDVERLTSMGQNSNTYSVQNHDRHEHYNITVYDIEHDKD